MIRTYLEMRRSGLRIMSLSNSNFDVIRHSLAPLGWVALPVLFIVGMAFGASGLTPIASPGSDPESNLQYLQELHRRDPQQYERLVRDFHRFQEMSPEQQEKLRRFDRQLHDEDSATQSRLLHVLGEYASWLTRLPAADQNLVTAETSIDERLKIVRELKERDWQIHLPLAQRTQLAHATELERKTLLDRWHRDEREQREEWAETRKWEALMRERPVMAVVSQESFRKELQSFIEMRMCPMLSAQEKAQ